MTRNVGRKSSYTRLQTVAARGAVMVIETGEETEWKNRFAQDLRGILDILESGESFVTIQRKF